MACLSHPLASHQAQSNRYKRFMWQVDIPNEDMFSLGLLNPRVTQQTTRLLLENLDRSNNQVKRYALGLG